MTMSIRSHANPEEVDEGYKTFEQLIAHRIATMSDITSLFTTNSSPEKIWDAYLSGLPEGNRQHYNCNCCRRFIQKYGTLATIATDGQLLPLLWTSGIGSDVPEFFRDSFQAMRKVVINSRITGVFVSPETVWGTPSSRVDSKDSPGKAITWTHLHGTPNSKPFSDKLLTDEQYMAEKKQDFIILSKSLNDYSIQAAQQALRLLKSETLYRSEKAESVAVWFFSLHTKLAEAPTGHIKGLSLRHNLIWQAVASAPPGFCHIRSTMISTLLDDIVSGLSAAEIQRRWADKLHPTKYQRPVAPPSEGSIKEAEKLVEKLGVASSLNRRYATLDDVLNKLWVPKAPEVAEPNKKGGVFDHLLPQSKKGGAVAPIELPTQVMTWEKFRTKILPEVCEIEIKVPYSGAFYGLATALDPASPPIIQWDGLEGHPRNPISWYYYQGGSRASDWNLFPDSRGFDYVTQWSKVTCIFESPSMWQEPIKFKHQGKQVFFAIEGCWDKRAAARRASGLFPEILKSEFHGIRKVIEAHAKVAPIIDPEKGTANGLGFANEHPVIVRVTTPEGKATYQIDRLD